MTIPVIVPKLIVLPAIVPVPVAVPLNFTRPTVLLRLLVNTAEVFDSVVVTRLVSKFAARFRSESYFVVMRNPGTTVDGVEFVAKNLPV